MRMARFLVIFQIAILLCLTVIIFDTNAAPGCMTVEINCWPSWLVTCSVQNGVCTDPGTLCPDGDCGKCYSLELEECLWCKCVPN